MFFASKYTPLIDNSVLPEVLDYISTARLSSNNFNNADILQIIKYVNVNKAHHHDNISVKMIMLCGQSIVKPLSVILKNCIDNGIFSHIWKTSNIIPVQKKSYKQFIDNYRPVSLYQFVVKFLKNCCSIQYLNLLMILIFSVLISQNSDHQNSCEYQLLSVVHDIYALFDCCLLLEVRGIFLDISKAFDCLAQRPNL